jgi:hypothetical protein
LNETQKNQIMRKTLSKGFFKSHKLLIIFAI